ncbi:hypothetical protein OS493_000638 [Desmophyllum pertusum]|uniref:Uncharacterized protein n=1 Tax=Desmophyllum pertusum TaxID=174260 RepID=A0A9X0A8M8_9CNID|nr:hypothetical protein OS493_000638 [Desmophyllum pertusum]
MSQLKDVEKQAAHKGLPLEQVGLRQQQRHTKEIREKAQKALWFAETYGLNLKSLNMEDSTGKPICLNLNSADATSSARRGVENDNICTTVPHQPESTSKPKQPYENLDDDEKENIKTILYIMDRFSISLEGYHELSQAQPSFPKTHLVESCAKVLDNQWQIKRTPGLAQGAELPLKILLENEIREHVSNDKSP